MVGADITKVGYLGGVLLTSQTLLLMSEDSLCARVGHGLPKDMGKPHDSVPRTGSVILAAAPIP